MAEAKFRKSRAQFEPLIRAQDADGILAALTFPVQARHPRPQPRCWSCWDARV